MTLASKSSPGPRPSREPGVCVWLIATISLILPWVGAPLALWGALSLAKGWDYAWLYICTGLGLVILDVFIDFVWAGSVIGLSDDLTLNRGGAMWVGRTGIVETSIELGRGKVRVGDSVWLAEGCDCAAGSQVIITDVAGTVLKVALSDQGERGDLADRPLP